MVQKLYKNRIFLSLRSSMNEAKDLVKRFASIFKINR